MTLKFPHWLASAGVAIALHIGVFVVAFSNDSQGALAEGKHGVEIDLGMLGDFGEQVVSQQAKLEPVHKKPEIKEKPPEKLIEPEIKPVIEKNIVKEAPPEPSPPIQKTDIAVFEEKPNTAKLPEKNDIEVDEPPIDDIAIVEPSELPPENELIEENDAAKKPNTQAQTKQNTGEANALNNGGQAGVDQRYLAKLLAQLAQHKRYPLSSRKRAQEGIAVLDFEISRTGRVLAFNIQQSSGFAALDKAVLKMLKRAEPFPPVPPDIRGEPIRFTLPISFKLNG